MLRIAAGAVIAMASASPALAHDGTAHTESPGWTLDPWVTVPLGLVLLIFLVGRSRLARRSGVERPRSWLFVAGWAVLAAALVSPLHEGGERSFTLHMIEHELIMLVATLLLAVARAGGTLAWGLPPSLRRALGGGWKSPLTAIYRRLTEPVTATVVQAVVMWAWHAPALFDRALESQGWHVAQHLSFILASLFFWTAMFGPRRGNDLLAAACLFLTSLVEGALGALMALSESPWYAAYAAMGVSGIGLDPAVDQQLAGLVMWIPGGLVHGAVALVLLYRWLARADAGPTLRDPTRCR
jgi:cytochrome c oxidase assembly factor CtaG